MNKSGSFKKGKDNIMNNKIIKERYLESMKEKVWNNENRNKKIRESLKKYYKEHPKITPRWQIKKMNIANLQARKDQEKEKVRNYKISKKLTGRILTESHRINISNSKTGIKYPRDIYPNQGMRGKKAWNKGLKDIFSKETRDNIAKSVSAYAQGVSIDKWERFIGFDPYTDSLNIGFKNFIRKRDNQICMNCGVHREKLNRALSIHHINYDKKLSIPQNCISLCIRCHSLTNINRKYWTELFQAKMSKIYGYIYDNSERIVLQYNEVIK